MDNLTAQGNAFLGRGDDAGYGAENGPAGDFGEIAPATRRSPDRRLTAVEKA